MEQTSFDWVHITNIFGFDGSLKEVNCISDEELETLFGKLEQLEIANIVLNVSLENIWEKLRKTVCPQFWQHFKVHSETSKDIFNGTHPIAISISTLVQAVEQLHDAVSILVLYVERIHKGFEMFNISYDGKLNNEKSLLGLLRLQLRATLYSQMPSCALELVEEVYSAAFRLFCHTKGHFSEEHEESLELKVICRGCQLSTEDCQCALVSQAFGIINGILQEHELLERLAGSTVEDLLMSAINDHVTLVCKDSFDKHRIHLLEEGLLKGNPARSHLIKFNGYSYTSLRAVIDFMYNGKVMVEQDNLAAFLKLGRALQVRGILDIAAQCEEAGLTTPEETKSNAQYSTTVQQSQKLNAPKLQPQQNSAESKKYAFLLDKNQQQKKPAHRKAAPNIIGSVDQQQPTVNKVNAVQVAQHQQQVLQQSSSQQQQQQQLHHQQQQQQQEATTIEELQQALASGQAILQTADPNGGGEQTLQMMEGQCIMTGSGQTYVVMQEGDNLSFVPAEMVQGDLAVNGGQVMESLDNVEQQLAQMEGQVLTTEGQVLEEGSQVAASTTQEDTGSLDTMSVVESLVKLGQKQPSEVDAGGEEAPEVGPDMPCLDSDVADTNPQVGPDMPDLGGGDAEEQAVDEPEPMEGEEEDASKEPKMGGIKRRAEMASGGRGKKVN